MTLTPLEQLQLCWFTAVVLQRLMAQLGVVLQRLVAPLAVVLQRFMAPLAVVLQSLSAQLAVVLQRLMAQLAVVLQRHIVQLAVAPEAYYYRPTSSRSPEVYRPIDSRSPEKCQPIGSRSPELYITQSAVLNYSYWRYSVQKSSSTVGLARRRPKIIRTPDSHPKTKCIARRGPKIHLKKGFSSVILKNPHCKQFVLNYFYCKLSSCIICNTNSHRQIFIFKQAVILNNSCSKQSSLTFNIKDSHPYYRQPS